MMRFAILLVLTAVMLGDNQSRKPEYGGPCCLCQCMSIDQNKCSSLCVRLQHSHKTINEPTINVCSRTCKRHGVKRLDPKTFWGQDWSKEK